MLYELEALRAVTGDTVHPGGYDLTRLAVDFCGLKAGSRLLDVGCKSRAGVEFLIKKFKLDAQGIDPSAKMLELGMQRCADLPIFQVSAEKVDFADDSMDTGDALDTALKTHAGSMVGIPTHVLRMARHEQGGQLQGHIKSVLLTTDHVPHSLSEAVELIWGCNVFNHYGMTEMDEALFRLKDVLDYQCELSEIAGLECLYIDVMTTTEFFAAEGQTCQHAVHQALQTIPAVREGTIHGTLKIIVNLSGNRSPVSKGTAKRQLIDNRNSGRVKV
ncbi:MAG: hypothetical protein JXA41_05845 [Deltaproteobacteria bacterium]|nr:hypothetical protein [Deltaproteobacteria bacterium]